MKLKTRCYLNVYKKYGKRWLRNANSADLDNKRPFPVQGDEIPAQEEPKPVEEPEKTNTLEDYYVVCNTSKENIDYMAILEWLNQHFSQAFYVPVITVWNPPTSQMADYCISVMENNNA